MDLLVPETVDGRYKVLDVIGTGAMATVYAAEDIRLGRKVAMKILRPEQAQDKTFRSRFKREAEAVASLNNPGIVAVYDTGAYSPSDPNSGYGVDDAADDDEAKIPYIVMEYVDGRTLRSVLSSGGYIPVRDAVGYAEQLLSALKYSHSMGIIHRDIKPANIMVLPRTEDDAAKGQPGQIKVMDFGIARAIEEAGEALTKANVVMGSARYMSPEQVSGKEVDARSDLYSAACVLYEMVAGRSPFDAETNVDLAAKHLTETPAAPSTFSPLSVPPELDEVILRGLAKNPDDRYQTADEFSQAIRQGAGLQVGGGMPQQVPDDSMTTAFAPLEAPAAGAAGTGTGEVDFDAYTTTMPQVSTPVEDANLNGFFDDDEYGGEEFVEEEEFLPAEQPRKRTWVRFLVGLAIAASLLLGIGSFLYYQGKLNEVPQVAIPTVMNQSKDDAENQLRNAGFAVESRGAYSENVKKGDVISVSPGEGTKAAKGSTVSLTYSNGPERVTLPDNLQGQSEAYVRNALKELGLKDGRVSTVESASVPAGMVVSLEPEKAETDANGKTTIEAGSNVNLVLSSGKVKVPSLVGLTKDQAIEALTASDVLLNTNIETVQTSSAAPNTVISQSSAAGTLVAQNSTVTIRVAAAPAATASASPRATTPSTNNNNNTQRQQGNQQQNQQQQGQQGQQGNQQQNQQQQGQQGQQGNAPVPSATPSAAAPSSKAVQNGKENEEKEER